VPVSSGGTCWNIWNARDATFMKCFRCCPGRALALRSRRWLGGEAYESGPEDFQMRGSALSFGGATTLIIANYVFRSTVFTGTATRNPQERARRHRFESISRRAFDPALD
jgi:hypothetical protein